MTAKLDRLNRSDAEVEAAPSMLLPIAATTSLIIAGMSLVVYALTGFATQNWSVAGPGLLVAAAGVGGIRHHWLYLAGLIPIAAIVSVAAAIQPGKRWFPVAALMALVGVPLVGWYVTASNPASAAPGDSVLTADRAFAVEVEMIDYSFVVDPALLQGGQVVHLRNTGTLPHDFSIPKLDVAVYVPPGRDTYFRLPRSAPESFNVVCTVGDHTALGTRLDIAKPDDT